MLALLASFGMAQAADEGPRFPIRGYDVAGAEALPPGAVDAVLARFVGPDSNFETIQQAVEALQALLVDRGLASARVFLPEQEVEDGRIRLKVVVAAVGRVEVEGNRHHDGDNIRNSLPGLAPGVVPDMKRITESLRVANENPSKQTQLVFRQAGEDGKIDAVLRVADEDPFKFGFSLDNTGSEATGSYRAGALLQHANLFNADHAVSAQVITSPGREDQVLIAGFGYRLPIYRWGDSMDFALGYSNVDSGTVSSVGGNYSLSGSGWISSVRYNHFMPRLRDVEQKAIFGLDYRRYGNEVRLAGSSQDLVPDIAVAPASLTYIPAYRRDGLDASASLGYVRNLPGVPGGKRSDFAAPGLREGARPDYALIRYGANLNLRVFGDWQVRGALNGQWTRDRLVGYEQFGLGGADSVRGFGERAVAKDNGVRGSLEILTQDLARVLGFEAFGLRAAVFGDVGTVRQNQPLPGEVQAERLAGAGIGVRLLVGRSVSARLDAARVIDGDGTTPAGAFRMHGQLIAVF